MASTRCQDGCDIQMVKTFSPTSTPLVEACTLTKQFGAVQALAGLDFRVMPGEIYGLLGSNGAGKTIELTCHYLHTLFHHIGSSFSKRLRSQALLRLCHKGRDNSIDTGFAEADRGSHGIARAQVVYAAVYLLSVDHILAILTMGGATFMELAVALQLLKRT